MQSYLRLLFFGLGLLGFVSQTKAQVFTPAAGSNQIDCGLNTTLCDHAGCSTDYSANVDGFTVVQVIGIGSVALSGSYTLGAGDTIFVYYGAGIGSAPVNTLTANGTYSLTGTVGQQVTVRFKSDGATQGTGFSFNVVYSGTCVLPGTNFTATGSQSFPCATNALFYDNGGGGANYTDGVSSTVVLNNAGVGVYSLSGTYDLESTFDFVRIYRGVGTGGTLLQTYTGAGSINFNSQPGETITIQFTSDGSVTRTGFAINTTHYGGCSCPPNPLSATATPNIICSGQNSQLLANGVANIANYRISQPAYAPLPCSGTSSGAGPSGDDQVSATVALPFPFVFFGNTYTQFGISTNANIQLGAGPYSAVYTPSGTGIPNTGIDNIIALNFADWLADAGDINWYVQGTAPNRRVVVCFNALKPYPSSSTGDFTGQIVLYEGTNEIDLVITTSTMGSGASTINLQTQGIQDAPGVGVPVPGRNSVNWTTSNNTMRFTPTLNYTYNWAPATFLNSTSIPNPLATAMTSSQNYTVTASLGALGVCPVTSTAPVTVTTIPSPTIAGTAVICVGQSTTLTASGGFTYLWSTGATTAAITVNPASNTTYSVTANPGGCSATASRIVTVNPSPSVAVSASALTICAPQNVTITATGASTYSWSSGQNTAVITVSPTTTTIYTVTGTAAGCTSTASTTITVNVLTVTCPSNVTVAECNAVVTFATPAATADVCSPPCTQAPLSTILANFNTNGTAIVSTISNRYNFSLDNGATATDIGDGGSDMYDTGNQLNTNLSTLIPYTGGVVTANANFGVGGSYFTQKVDNMFVMVADINNLTSFFTTGNNGADSGGTANGFTFSFTVGCQTYNAFVKRVFGAGDPSINQIMIVPANASASQTFATDTNDGLHTLSGISSSTRLYYLLLGGTSGYQYTNTELQNAAQTFITQVGASVGSTGSGLTTVTQASGLTSGSTFPVGTNTISFRAMSASGASATCSSTIVVTPNATVTTQPTNRTACAGDILTFNTAVSNGASFQWEYRSSAAGVFGDITNGIGNAPGYLNTVAGATTTTLTLPLMTIANAVSGMQVRLRVTGSNGCVVYSNIATITINALPTPSVTGTNVICNGQSTTLTASGASTYAWSSGQNTAVITVAPTTNTTYTVTGTNASSCTATANRTVTVNALPTPAVAGINTICNGQSTTLTASGANTYAWSSGQNTAAITVAPTANTTYTVTATDVNGCTATASRTVTVNTLPTPAVAGINTICNGQSTTLTASGASSYVWSSGQNTAAITVAPTTNTTYTVTATDVNGCTATASRTVTVNTLPTPAVAGTNVICNGQSTTLTASGANTYAWSSGQNTAVITVAPTANTTYTVTATDANGCTATANRTVTVNALPTPAITGTNVICNGQSTTLSATGGTSYVWSNGQTITPVTVFPTVNTTYTLTATNAAGCTATASRTVTVNTLPTPAVAGTNVICNGQSTTLTASGANTYAWSSGQNTAAITIAPTANTTYTVTATDVNGCTATASRTVTVNTLPTPAVAGTNVICNGQSTTLTASGANTYAWSSGQNTAAITVAPTANTTYTVTATDANGCTATANRTVTVNALPTPAITGTNVICNGQSTTLSATGGTSYVWSNGQTITPVTVFPTVNTTYTLTATNAAGCTATASRAITVNAVPTPAVAGSSVICNGQSSVLTASGGNTYIWSSGQNTAVITVTPSVTTFYEVTATDANGCTATANRFVNVNALPTPTVAGINTICNGQSTTLTASGANTYVWSSGQNTAVITVAPTANTTYTVTATNGSGCTATANRTVTVNALPTPAVAGINTICNGQSTTLTASGASSYVWSSGQNTAVITVAPTANTTYTVTATDANGCTATANRTVTVNPLPTPTINSSSFIVCDNSSMTITATGGSTYSWSSGQNTAVITVSPTANITYTVTATSAAGCTATTSQAVTVNQSSTVPSIPVMVSTVCPNTNTVLTASGGTAGTGSVIRWYSGANGTGLLGTGASLTVSPASNTVYYARREGACNNSSDASVTVTTKTFIYALHGTTTNTYCTDNFGWSHFYVGDEIILSVQGNFSGAATGFPRATIYDNGTYRQSPGTNPVPNCIISGLSTDEKFEMARAWDFNLGTGGTPVGTYNVRFYYKPAERTAIETAAANWMSTYASCGYSYKYATPLGFYWFKNTLGTYVPPLYDGLHLTGTTGTAGATNYGQFNGITSFSGGSGAVILTPTVILPITYLQFTGENRGKYNHLDWITVQELNNEYFEVERSIDGVNFVKIGEVLAQRGGAQNQERAYAFDDMNPAIGTNYYRLRQVDTDRSSSLSQIVALDLVDNNTNYQFFPNPTENTVNYQIRTLQAEDVDIMVLDMLGRQLSLKTYKSVAGFNNFSVDLSNFAAGSYVVKALHKNSKVQHVSVIIKTSR